MGFLGCFWVLLGSFEYFSVLFGTFLVYVLFGIFWNFLTLLGIHSVSGNDWKWLEWLEINRNAWTLLEMAGMAVYDWI